MATALAQLSGAEQPFNMSCFARLQFVSLVALKQLTLHCWVLQPIYLTAHAALPLHVPFVSDQVMRRRLARCTSLSGLSWTV